MGLATTRKIRHWATPLLAAAFIAGLLGACTGESSSDPSGTPTADAAASSASPSPSASATSAPLSSALTEAAIAAALPDTMAVPDFDSAVNFSQFFIESYAPMFTPPYDSDLFAALSEDECAFCASSLEHVEESRAAGVVNTGGEFSWPDSDGLAGRATGGLASDDYWYLEQRFAVTDTASTFPDGTTAISAGGTGKVTTKLGWNGSHWTVFGVNFAYDDE